MLDKLILRLQALGVDVVIEVYAAQGFGHVTYEVTYNYDGAIWMTECFASQPQAIDHIKGLLDIINGTTQAALAALEGGKS